MAHPHQSMIDFLRRMVTRLPPQFPRELGRYMAARIEELGVDLVATEATLHGVTAEFGAYLWHYRKAFEELFDRVCAPKLAERFLAALPGGLRERVVADSAGAPLEVLRAPAFEANYSPEETLIIEEALLSGKHSCEEDLRNRIDRGELPEYEHLALQWKRVRLDMEEQLLALRRLAIEKPQLVNEIQEAIIRFGDGIAGTAPEPTFAELRGAVADYANRT